MPLYAILRQGLGLQVVPVLQAVFELAQEAVGFEQGVGGMGGDDVLDGELAQGFLRAFQLQGFQTACAYHLEDLGDEFDFAYAARTEFDVVFHAFFTDFGADLAVQAAHGFVGVVIKIFAEDEGADDGGDVVCAGRDDAAFAPCVAFPFAAVGDEVLFECGFTPHQRARVAVGAQAHIDAEYLAVGGNVV